jgi:secondary thiamine-phosphate synthase enzyme
MRGTLSHHPIVSHSRLRVDTQTATQFIDVTDELEALIARAGLQTGFVNIQSLHTTAAVVISEHEPLLLDDLSRLLDRVVPKDDAYQHDDASVRTVNCVPGERANGHSHCRALLLTSAICLNVVDGRPELGRWQRVFFVELDGPRSRELSVVLVGETEQ